VARHQEVYERGTGILNNELYIGRLVWNRLRYLKDPDTGKRVSRQNPDSALIVNEVPAMRIVDQELWDRAKARQQGLKVKQAKDKAGFWDRRRPRYLFSGLMKCGECGGGFVKISEHYFGCSTARNKGTCTNLTAIKREVLEETVLGGLHDHLMDPALIDIFCTEYTRHLNRLRSDAVASSEGHKAELAKIDRETERLIDAIVGGVPASKVKDRMTELDARKTELEKLLESAPQPPPVLVHPRMGDRYREEVGRLRDALNDVSRREEAAEIVRGLIDSIVLQPSGSGRERTLTIDLTGHLAGILNLARETKKGAAGAPASDQQIKLVAGARFGRDRHIVTAPI
jgi:site-specific DNA recombinase